MTSFMWFSRLICRIGCPTLQFFAGIGVALCTTIIVAIVTLPSDLNVSVKELFFSSGLFLLASFSAFIVGDKVSRYEANYSDDVSLEEARESLLPGNETKTRVDSIVQQLHDGFRWKYLWIFMLLCGLVGGLLFLMDARYHFLPATSQQPQAAQPYSQTSDNVPGSK